MGKLSVKELKEKLNEFKDTDEVLFFTGHEYNDLLEVNTFEKNSDYGNDNEGLIINLDRCIS